MQNNKRQPQSTVTDGGIPIWDIQRIKVTLDSCDIPVSAEDIMKPNVNSSTGIFQGLLEVIMGIAAEDIEYSKTSLLPTMKHQVSFWLKAMSHFTGSQLWYGYRASSQTVSIKPCSSIIGT